MVHGNTVYLSGVTAQADGNGLSEQDTVEEQTRRTLAVIDDRLAKAGVDKSRILTCQSARRLGRAIERHAACGGLLSAHAPRPVAVWLKDIGRDFKGMNDAYSAWVDQDNKPCRATVQSPLASPLMLVEIQVTAARGEDWSPFLAIL